MYGYARFVTTDEDDFVEAVSTCSAKDSEVRHFLEMMDKAKLPAGKTVLYDKGADSSANR